MENKINIAKLLKDCPKGMELDCTMYDDVYFDYTDMCNIIHCYIQHEAHKTSITFNQYGTYNSDIKSKCVIFPKGKTTWEGFKPPYEFKDGDIVSDGIWIGITQGGKKYRFIPTYCVLKPSGSFEAYLGRKENWAFDRLATEEEKQRLFNAIKANGYKWNEETKTLETLIKPKFKVGDIIQYVDSYKVNITEVNIEDECYEYESMIAKGIGSIDFKEQDNWELVPNKFDFNTLKTFDKVLVRCDNNGLWNPQFFAEYRPNSKFPFVCIYNTWSQCIPYEANKELLGTANSCDEFYKTWE